MRDTSHASRQAGEMDAACIRRLEERHVSLDDPSWFISYTRPAGYPRVVPVDNPQPPFTLVGVATHAETEPTYFGRVRPQALYQDAFGLQPLADPVDADVPAGMADPAAEATGIVRNAAGRVVHICCERVDHWFWQCVSLLISPLCLKHRLTTTRVAAAAHCPSTCPCMQLRLRTLCLWTPHVVVAWSVASAAM